MEKETIWAQKCRITGVNVEGLVEEGIQILQIALYWLGISRETEVMGDREMVYNRVDRRDRERRKERAHYLLRELAENSHNGPSAFCRTKETSSLTQSRISILKRILRNSQAKS